MTPLEAAAHEYLSAGLKVLALTGKQPNTRWHPHGLNDYIAGVPENAEDDTLIRRVFSHSNTTGIGLVIEFPYFVIDVDGEEGAVTLSSILSTTDLPETPVAKTARGLHIWMSDLVVRRSTTLGPKLDLKGPGGYVAAPPSLHPSGHVYTWLRPLVDADSGQPFAVMEVPAKIERYLSVAAKITATRDVDYDPGWKMDAAGIITLAPADISGLLRAIRDEPVGNQNNLLAWAAWQAGNDGVPLEVFIVAAVPVAVEAGATEQKARGTIRNVYRRLSRNRTEDMDANE